MVLCDVASTQLITKCKEGLLQLHIAKTREGIDGRLSRAGQKFAVQQAFAQVFALASRQRDSQPLVGNDSSLSRSPGLPRMAVRRLEDCCREQKISPSDRQAVLHTAFPKGTRSDDETS